MRKIADYSPTELKKYREELINAYSNFQKKNKKLDMSRGKPSPAQLDLSNAMLDKLEDYHTKDNVDARNYGVLDGIKECREMFSKLLGIAENQMIIGGNSSLNMMYDMMVRLCLFGTNGSKPWKLVEAEGKKVKFLCPTPGYDRHFAICEALGIEMISIPLLEAGPDMDQVEELVKQDPLIKGIWCVPLHSNPQGICYSDAVVRRLACMKTAACDFRIFWDNAYGIHHIYEEVSLLDIIGESKRLGNPNRPYYFFSTSKISHAGAGIALMASGEENITEVKRYMAAQTIGSDKLNQLRHVHFFKDAGGIRRQMAALGSQLRPKFDMVLQTLEQELGGSQMASWSKPQGGYFISVDTIPGCAKEVVRLAKEAGVVLTGAGATYPYGIEEEDKNIRIAPSYPTIEELKDAMELFCLCVKLVAVNQLLLKMK